MTLLILTAALRITLTLWLTGENFSTSLVCERDREEGKERKKERKRKTERKRQEKRKKKERKKKTE